MTEKPRSILDLVVILIDAGLSPETSLRVSREIDAAFGLSTKSSGSTAERREKWRAKKARQRARGELSPGDKSRTAIVDEVNTISLSKQVKDSKSGTSVSPVSPGDKPKRSKGDLLPDDWKPTEDHYAFGAKLNFSREAVDGFADRMRDWSIANAHRQVARKSGTRGWNAAFRTWLDGAAKRNGGTKNEANRTQSSRGGGFASLAARVRFGGSAAPEPERPAPEDLRPVNR